MPNNIFLFTAPVQAGKTTALMNWVKNKKRIGGFLTPDREGLRYLYTLENRQFHDFQVEVETAKVMPANKLVTVGKFNFYAAAMALAQQTLLNDVGSDFDWIIIDEIGKLELRGKGLEPVAGQIIKHFQTRSSSAKLLLVVRESLLDAIIQRYKLEDCRLFRLGETLP